MKEIRTCIEPFMLSKVTQALLAIPGFLGMSMSPDMSVSIAKALGREFIIERDFTPYLPKKRIEIFASDKLWK